MLKEPDSIIVVHPAGGETDDNACTYWSDDIISGEICDPETLCVNDQLIRRCGKSITSIVCFDL